MTRTVKRKLGSTSSSTSRKKVKTKHLTANELPWKRIRTSTEAGLGPQHGFDGILELEEVEDVEVVYEETEAGRVVKFNVIGKEDSEEGDGREEEVETVVGPSTSPLVESPKAPEPQPLNHTPFDSELLLPNWHSYTLHPTLLRSLHSQNFTSPTPIQKLSLPVSLSGRDIIGVAETGSGKTLAYGLPILHKLLVENEGRTTKSVKREVKALVLAPTRELALQVSSHLNACLNEVEGGGVKQEEEEEAGAIATLPEKKKKGKSVRFEDGGRTGKEKEKEKRQGTSRVAAAISKAPPVVSVAAIVGGMSAQKQRRILDRGVDVMVATPGRLWDILQENDDLAAQMKRLKFLVLDEADRMVETGHFAELDNILRLTLRVAKDDVIQESRDREDDEAPEPEPEKTDGLQTFVFSATLSKDLQQNLKKHGHRPKHKGKKHTKPASTLDVLVMRLDFRDPEPEVIDLSPEGGVVSTLKESQIDCLAGDKDAYLYYFLLRYPGRSLVFVSSIDGIRRLLPLLELLEIKTFPLHSQLEQRQRLKNLDRFKTTPNSVLLATDIAARGLDIPSVDHVVHYQIPRSADVYVHRNGRTARAMREGFSLLMCAPDERRLVRALMGSLGRREEDIPEMFVELYLVDRLKERVQLAKQIDQAQHKIKKENHEKNWLRETAEAMEIEVDSDLGLSSDDEDGRPVPNKHQKKKTNAKTAMLKSELKELLSQPLIARGISTRYITSGSRPVVDDLISGEYHETMLGLKKIQATQDVSAMKRKSVKKTKNKRTKAEQDEWHGFGPTEEEQGS